MPVTYPKTIPFTREAYEKLQTDFDRLTAERKEVLKRLQTAREMGDLSENGAYKYAKFELGSIGRQLAKTRQLLQQGFIQDKPQSNSQVAFGTTVTLLHKDKNTTHVYMIVSQHESNPMEGKLSTDSPLGKVLMGKRKDEEVVFETPRGGVTYTITDIQ